jgi:AcrR family transcriptional regulator
MFPGNGYFLPLSPEMSIIDRTDQPDEMKTRIMQGAESLFLRYGFKSITMDDIARELGISKKTLYQYFSDKTDLVNQVVDNHLAAERHLCARLEDEEKDPIAYLLAVSNNFSNEQKHISAAILYDLKKYFKEAWDKIEAYSKNFIYNQILRNLNDGIAKGLYRKEINERVIALHYVNMIQFLVNPENYQREERDFKVVHRELMTYHLHGILTDKGLKQLDKLLTNNNI